MTVAFADERVQRLVEEVQAHYVVIYGGRDESPVDPTEFEAPHGLFALGTLDGQEVAMGGWRHRPDLAEMFAGGPRGRDQAHVRRARRAGARASRGRILTYLEDTARGSGVDQLVLETGTMQPDAIALYEARGYVPTVRFGHYADSALSRYYAKPLGPAPT